ncbi:MAG TPA: hypothetical protein VGN34_04305, partial [Ktedonobacteraceae bacterium]
MAQNESSAQSPLEKTEDDVLLCTAQKKKLSYAYKEGFVYDHQQNALGYVDDYGTVFNVHMRPIGFVTEGSV